MSESTPLLPKHAPSSHGLSWHTLTTLFLAVLVVCLMETGSVMESIPLAEITEDIVCRSYISQSESMVGSAAAEDRCKQPDVQADVANIQAWRSTVETIPSLLLAVPYGLLADKYSASKILALSGLGGVLAMMLDLFICLNAATVSVKLLILSPLLTVVGGGSGVFIAMTYAIIGDATTATNRATVFSLMFSGVLGAKLIATALTYYTMAVSTWLCLYTSIGVSFFASIISYFIPESGAGVPKSRFNGKTPPQPLFDLDDLTIRDRLNNLVHSVKAAVRWACVENRSAALVTSTLILTSLGGYAKILELQYITKRYGTSWPEAAMLLNSRTITSLVLYIAVIPAISQYLTKSLRLTPTQKDLLLARVSILFNVLGCVIVGLAFNIPIVVIGTVIMSFGSGFIVSCMSLVSSLVPGGKSSSLYTVIGLMQSVGILISGPIIAAIFKVGLNMGGIWIGMPYIVVAGTYGLTFVILGFVTLDGRENRGDTESVYEMPLRDNIIETHSIYS